MPRGRCVTRSIAETYAARGVVVVGVGVDGWASLGEASRHAPVSYTHLDVYKRQAMKKPRLRQRLSLACSCLLYTSRCV